MAISEKRTCGWCGKPIWYGLFCLYTDCDDKSYEQWKGNDYNHSYRVGKDDKKEQG